MKIDECIINELIKLGITSIHINGKCVFATDIKK